jgi:hypothetical protein
MRIRMSVVLRAGVIAGAFLLSGGRETAHAQEPAEMKVPAPDFKGIEEWINSKPKTWKDLRGQVVVLHFWTFG